MRYMQDEESKNASSVTNFHNLVSNVGNSGASPLVPVFSTV